MDFENRLVELETKISFQEQSIEDLSQALYKQQQHTAQLEKSLELLKKQITADLNSEGEIRPHEKPPHY